MAEDDAQRAGAEGLRGEHVVLVLLGEHLGTGEARECGDREKGDRNPDVTDARTENREDGEGREQSGEGEEGIDEAHGGGFGQAPEEAGEEADRDSNHGADGHADEAHGEGGAQPEEGAREEVAAELVGAEPVFGGRAQETSGCVLGDGVVDGDDGGAHGSDHQEHEPDDGDSALRIVDDAVDGGEEQGLTGLPSPPGELKLDSLVRRGHRPRTLGSRKP